jgi:phage terminase small subunit
LSASEFLNEKQKKFCELLVVCGNQAEAAREAGYSERTARSIAARLLTNVNVQKYLEELREKYRKSTGITANKVLNEIAKIGFAEIQMQDIRPADKLKALEKLGQHLGLFSDLHAALSTLTLYGERTILEDGSFVFRLNGSVPAMPNIEDEVPAEE